MSDTYHSDGSASYSFWTWFIAIIAIIALLWAWHHDRWLNGASCCADAPVAAAPAAMEPFNFAAGSHEDFASTGDSSSISWFGDIPALESWLSKGDDWKVSGDAKHVVLTGTVDSEATKTARGQEAQAYFGSSVTVDNQLIVALPAVEPAPEVVVPPIDLEADKPENVRVYFDVNYHALPAAAPAKLTDIISWAKTHPESKVVVSGYHDPTGNQIMNIELSKNRAKSVYSYLLSQGVPEERIELRKPQSTEGDGDYQEARRSEVSIE